MMQEVLVPIRIPLGCGIRCFPRLRMGLSRCNPVALRHDPAPPEPVGLLLAPHHGTPIPAPLPWDFCSKGMSGFVLSAAGGRAVVVPFGSRCCLFLLVLPGKTSPCTSPPSQLVGVSPPCPWVAPRSDAGDGSGMAATSRRCPSGGA